MPIFLVMAGLVPAIHVFLEIGAEEVDARDKPGHDELESSRRSGLPICSSKRP
jgi:hypothetical protein